MPGERDLRPFALEAREGDPLQEVAIAGVEVVVDPEPAVAVVLGPDQPGVRVGTLALGAEHVGVAVAVEVGDRGHVVERRADRAPLPGAGRLARVPVPPAAGDDVLPAVAVEVGRGHEHAPPGLVGVDHVAPPAVEPRLPVQEHVDPRRALVVGLGQDVEIAVAVQVGQPQLVIGEPLRDDLLAKMPAAVAVEDPGGGLGTPAGIAHLGREDVEVAVLIDVAERQAVAVHDVGAEQIVADPGVAVPLIPSERPGVVAGPEHDLRAGRPARAGPRRPARNAWRHRSRGR